MTFIPRVSCLLLILVATLVQAQDKPTFAEATVHDPALIRADDGRFYVFGSHLASASSADLMHWTQISTSAAPGNALVPNPAVEFSEALTWAQTTTFWAPDVFRLPSGKYAYYYNACKGDSPLSALGLATADAITGPYKNVAVFLKSGMWGQTSPDGRVYDATIHPNVVDPSLFYDAGGTLWMVYGSFSGGIFILKMDPASGLPEPNQGYGRKLIGGNHSRIEGPHIVYAPETGYYYLFLTFGGLDASGGYNVRLGRSRAPEGPYLDAEGNDLSAVRGRAGTLFDDATIAPYGVKVMGNWQFLKVAGEPGATTRGYVSPGGVQSVRDPATGRYLLAFHTRFVGRGEMHEVRVHQMYLSADGWFVLAPHRFARGLDGGAPVAIDPNAIPGDYKIIRHGKDITAAVKTSTVVTLHADGTLAGGATGNWGLQDDAYATLVLGGVTHRGVFSREWDEDHQTWVLAFSVLDPAGQAVWGSRVTAPRPAAAPVVTRAPESRTLFPGERVELSVGATAEPAATYQWFKDGVAITGATHSRYTLAAFAVADAGHYTVSVTNSAGSVTSAAALLSLPLRPAQVTVANGAPTTQVVNLSSRGIVATGSDVLVAGFVISGTAPKQVLVRAVGSNLRRFGLAAIAQPQLDLFTAVQGVQTVIASNADWREAGPGYAAAAAKTYAFALEPATEPGYGDAALLLTLTPGLYTAQVKPAATSANQEGVGLVEVYDVTPDDGSLMVNLSCRGRVEPGAPMIVGVSVVGAGESRLLVRGVGPALRAVGLPTALADPALVWYRGQSVLGGNEDWWNSPQADQIETLGGQLYAFALPPYSADAAALVRVGPDTYTAVIESKPGEAGVALAEIYDATVR